MGVRGQHHFPAALPPGKRGWVGPSTGLYGVENRKSLAPPKFEPQTVQHVRSYYTDRASRPHKDLLGRLNSRVY